MHRNKRRYSCQFVLGKKTNNITQWTVDSKPHKNNCLFGPHGPKLKALLFHTKRKEYTARPSMRKIKNENPLAHCNLTTKLSR